MRVTLRDVAAELGVSPATVSRVLNRRGRDFISESTRQRVMETARKLGYLPNAAARSLVTGRTNVIALWLHNRYSFSAFVGHVVHTIMAQVRDRPIELMVEYLEKPDSEDREWTPMGQWRVDGVLAHEAPHYVASHLASGRARVCPIVGMGCWYHPQADYVGVDLTKGVQEAVLHLLRSSDDGVAYLVNAQSNTPGEPRYEAYHRTLHEAGVAPRTIVCQHQSRASAREAILAYCDKQPPPSSIFCHNDDLALGAYRALVELGVRIPDDVALVGCDGIEDTQYTARTLSTIVQPVGEMCRLALQALEARLADPGLPQQATLLEAHLRIGESSR